MQTKQIKNVGFLCPVYIPPASMTTRKFSLNYVVLAETTKSCLRELDVRASACPTCPIATAEPACAAASSLQLEAWANLLAVVMNAS